MAARWSETDDVMPGRNGEDGASGGVGSACRSVVETDHGAAGQGGQGDDRRSVGVEGDYAVPAGRDARGGGVNRDGGDVRQPQGNRGAGGRPGSQDPALVG